MTGKQSAPNENESRTTDHDGPNFQSCSPINPDDAVEEVIPDTELIGN